MSGQYSKNAPRKAENIEKYARKRAFSLKRPFVNQFWESIIDPDSFESIQESLNLPAEASIENKLLELFQPLVGLTIGKISKNIGIEIKDAKLKDGMLTIKMERIVPEEDKPVSIKIK